MLLELHLLLTWLISLLRITFIYGIMLKGKKRKERGGTLGELGNKVY